MSGTNPLLAAFEHFCQQELRGVVRHLRMSGFDQHCAEDAAQEAMVELLEVWEAQQVTKPRAWVRRVASRKAMALLARERLLRQAHGLAAEQVELLVPPDAGDEGVFNTTLQYLRQLPPGQQRIMAWYFDDYEPREIAEHTGLQISTVRSHIRHARQHLKLMWEADHEGGDDR
ncbi:RNA polymerase sigma factor [Streptomyces avermitilis]